MKKKIGIFWIREDFRILKNNALAAATKNHDQVVAIYILKKIYLKIERRKVGGYVNL